ncbi:acetolactate synthase large subunit [Bacillus sp. 1NLA3E]|uniref:acetolactate synthase large subunit n=1 Tax=Bacillus sp. 1NLA3E TaxID=666686 RepID=UPI000247F048|nr:acetolactate synthase large subunit [Bacillus sp. 1NLA3E]AGK54007.1 acetolactate synthase [Bacillus sp. 1NLA3E]
MKVTDVLVQCLENEGVEFVFGIVGKETLDLADSLSKSKQIQFVNVRHEQGAAFMADVYGRLSKKVGVCLSTLGPGATNLMTGIASAHLDHSPVVALIGQAGMERQHKESHQYLDIVKIFEPVTKWSTQIKESQTVPTIIRKAFRAAKMGKSGAVAISLPENFSAQMIPNKPLPITPLPESVPVSGAIKAANNLLQKHLKPFLIIGHGVLEQNAFPELQTFINTLQSPVTHSFMTKGVLAKEHPLNYFTFGFNENDLVLQGIKEADLLIVIGLDFVEKLPKAWNERKLSVLHIDTLPAEINEYYPVEVELVGNIKKTLQLLLESEIHPKSWVPTGNLQEQIKTAYQINRNPDKPSLLPLTIENVLHIIEKYSSENTIVISDVGAHKVSIARTYQPKVPNKLIISNGLASMGIALPGSIGAKLACPNDPVICITGDGGALMNFAEIETAKRLGLALIIIVLNDSMLKLEVQQMNKMFGTNYGVTFQNPDFVQLAASFGIKGVRISDLRDFENVLKEKLQTLEEIVLIEIAL